MKKSIIVLVVGVVLYLSGFVLLNIAETQRDNSPWYYGWQVKESRENFNTSKTISELLKVSGIIVAIGGGLWLIVLTIKEKKI